MSTNFSDLLFGGKFASFSKVAPGVIDLARSFQVDKIKRDLWGGPLIVPDPNGTKGYTTYDGGLDAYLKVGTGELRTWYDGLYEYAGKYIKSFNNLHAENIPVKRTLGEVGSGMYDMLDPANFIDLTAGEKLTFQNIWLIMNLCIEEIKDADRKLLAQFTDANLGNVLSGIGDFEYVLAQINQTKQFWMEEFIWIIKQIKYITPQVAYTYGYWLASETNTESDSKNNNIDFYRTLHIQGLQLIKEIPVYEGYTHQRNHFIQLRNTMQGWVKKYIAEKSSFPSNLTDDQYRQRYVDTLPDSLKTNKYALDIGSFFGKVPAKQPGT